MDRIEEIHWHDSEIESVVELPASDELIYNVMYPEDWDNNKFEPRSITFRDYFEHSVQEMPFEGNPTILSVTPDKVRDGYIQLKIETNAGNRFVEFKSCHLGSRRANI